MFLSTIANKFQNFIRYERSTINSCYILYKSQSNKFTAASHNRDLLEINIGDPSKSLM